MYILCRLSQLRALRSLPATKESQVMRSLTGQSVVITGAGRGIGKAIALRLAAEGAHITALARTQHLLDELKDEIYARGGEALVIAADVTDSEAATEAVGRATERFGPVSILVNNAGIPGPYGPVDAVDPAEWWAAQAVNVLGPFNFMHAVIPSMRKSSSGRIINIVSNAGLQPVPHLSAYAVSKNTLTRLTETVDLELRGVGVRAFALNPGNITTDMARGTLASPEAKRWLGEGLAMIRDRTPEDSAADLQRCCEVVLALAAGKYDVLAGRYLDIGDELDALSRAS
jgi:NAD(P)-dependent dehydrogenase (short-subunit alcohol dehydrogenase family)